MDRTPWRTNDPTWVENQEKKWPLIKARIEYSFCNREHYLDAALEAGEEFFWGRQIELPTNESGKFIYADFFIRMLAHPELSEKNIITMMDDFRRAGFEEHLPFPTEFHDFAQWCRDYVSVGLIDESVVENYMNVMYGHSLDEYLTIHKLDFEERGVVIIENLCRRVSAWYVQDVLSKDDVTLIDRWLKLLDETFKRLNNDQVVAADFRVKKIFRLMSVFEDNTGSAHIPRSIDKMAKLRKQVIAGRDNYCLALQKFVDELEEKLRKENKI